MLEGEQAIASPDETETSETNAALARKVMTFPKPQYNVVLVYPPSEVILEMYDLPDFPNIGIAYLGGYLEKHTGIIPALIDAKLSRLSLEETVAKILDLNPKVVGMGAMTPMIMTASRIFAALKKAQPQIVTVLGGFHASTLPERTLKEFPMVDYVCVGEGEMAFAELSQRVLDGKDPTGIPGIWRRLGERIVGSGSGAIPATLDELGEPAWHLYEQDVMAQYCRTVPVMGQRGCPFGCTFCSRPYGRTVRRRSSALVADEIVRNIDRYHPEKVHFYDETFSVNKKHTLELCDELIARGVPQRAKWTSMVHANTIDMEVAQRMKDAGCIYVGYGVESGDDDIIAQMNKGVSKKRIIETRRILKKVGITTMGFFMVGHPNETRHTMWRTIKFAARLNPDVAAIGIMVPYPGTEIWDLANKGEGGYVKLSPNWDDYNKQLGNAVQLKNLSRREIEMFQVLGYALIFILNLRFIDLFKVARKHIKLLTAMLLKLVLPGSVNKKVMIFRNDGGRLYKEKRIESWG